MPEALLLAFAAAVLATMLAAMARILRGPGPSDRIAGVLLLGTGGVAVLLLLAEAYGARALRDVALILALLAAVTAIAWARIGDERGPHPGELERAAREIRAPDGDGAREPEGRP